LVKALTRFLKDRLAPRILGDREAGMSHSPPTRPSLLARLRDVSDVAAWSEFVDLYAPLVYGFARRHGLQDADAADLLQDVFCNLVSALDEFAYDRRRGSFRGWLFTVARNQLRKRFRRRAEETGNHELLDELPAPDPDAATWDREYEQRLFAWAAERARPDFQESTWQAFWQTTVERRGARDVAQALGMSVGAVYIAKSRVLARLRALIDEAETL
jgi:RNA polymerase sigma factor (sigma-70 family)